MEIRDILKNLREQNHLTQDQMAERVMVTRQAVSRWETVSSDSFLCVLRERRKGKYT